MDEKLEILMPTLKQAAGAVPRVREQGMDLLLNSHDSLLEAHPARDQRVMAGTGCRVSGGKRFLNKGGFCIPLDAPRTAFRRGGRQIVGGQDAVEWAGYSAVNKGIHIGPFLVQTSSSLWSVA